MRFAATPDAPVFVAEPFMRGGVQYMTPWLSSAWAQEPELVTALGIGPVTEADPAPDGQVLISETLRHGPDGFYVEAVYGDPPSTPLPALAELILLVNRDRDRRIESGFLFEGKVYQSRASDRENITRKGDRAEKVILAATITGGTALDDLAGDLTWDVTTAGQPFAFKALDNSWTPMDAFKMVEMRDAGEGFKQTCTFAADAAKVAMLVDGTDAGAKAIYDAIAWPPVE